MKNFWIWQIALGSVMFLIGFVAVSSASAQRRDEMTDDEIELVRNHQELDLRMSVLIKMIDRRFSVLGIEVGTSQEMPRKSEKWGEPPTGTRTELFADIRKILYKATDDIDVAAQNDENAMKPETKSGKIFSAGVKKLDHAVKRYLPALEAASSSASSEIELGHILNAIELCEQVIEAAKTLPEPSKRQR